jgi:ketosteroid isomerase-like protein
MAQETALRLSTTVLDAWNRQDVDSVLACYTPDCVYLDPNTRGPVLGHDALRRYLTRLFDKWRMHWSMREFFPFGEGDSGDFLCHATLTPAGGGTTAEIDGMDLALVRDGLLYRNEVYFDRMALFGAA